ncbi:MAG TPA: hypothetical protein VF158_14105 [Longimicrobiales bacterium]
MPRTDSIAARSRSISSWRPNACAVLRAALIGGLLAVPGCADVGAGADAAPITVLEDALTWGSRLSLEETEGVINVWPMVRKDPYGGFLVADMREGAIRRYSPEGKLLFTIGRTGDGPAEFRSPSVALRLPTGEILALTMEGEATVLDSAGRQPLRTARLPVGSIEDAEILNDSVIVVSGISGSESGSARIHLWDFRRDSLLASFFTPAVGDAVRDAAMVARWTSVAVLADTIAAAFAPLDTIFLFTANGTQVGKVPLRSMHFRRATPMPEEARRDRRARTAWVGSFHLVSGVEWVPGGFLVQYQGFENMTPYFNLLKVSRTGELIFDLANSPRFLLLADSTRAYFVDPDAEVPNRWVVATFH